MRRGVWVFLLVAGCGTAPEQERVLVTGSVKWKNEKLAGALVTFVPIGDTPGGGGSGQTEPDGTFQVTDVRGTPGIPPGDQFVVLRIETPPADSRAAKDAYRRFADEVPFNPRAKLETVS